MWDRSYRWQRIARVAAGLAALVVAAVAVTALSSTPTAARASDGLSELAREASPEAEAEVVCRVPADLGVRVGTLVYLHREDGVSEIVGRVREMTDFGDEHQLTVLLTPTASGVMVDGGKLLGAKPTFTIEHAFWLLIRPDTPRDEARIARDMFWPAIKEHMMPGLNRRLEREILTSFEGLDAEDDETLKETLNAVHEEMAPLEEKLLNRLAERSWEVIGVAGVAEGVIRKAGDAAGNKVKDVTNWVKGIFGGDESEHNERDFLSEEKRVALRLALEEETENFWKEHSDEISRKFNKVFSTRKDDLGAKFQNKWGKKLYENAVVPSWYEGEPAILDVAEEYAKDFARRRLLTKEGGPRLLLAHALRSALKISRDPLLVIAPANGANGKVEFEWLMPKMPRR